MVLNTVQKDAIIYDKGPQLVFAGAGTGKTRVLTAKIAYLIENGLYPGQIFAATFTNKAAREMRSRVESLIGIPVDGLWIGTFHSMCARIMRRDGKSLGYDPSFTIFDSNDQNSLIKKILKKLDIDDRTMAPKSVLHAISRYKNACITPQELDKSAKSYYEQEILKVYKSYQKALKEQQAMDFDDLLFNTVQLFLGFPDVLEQYRNRFKYVLVDEYQDTNNAQFQIIKLLSVTHGKIFAVGDDDQSIYGWRGAQVKNILSFEHQFTDTKIFKLEQNYRSTKTILNFANAAIASNCERAQKQLWTDTQGGAPVTIVKYRDDRQEAETVTDRIAQTINGSKIKGSDIAILFRTNAQSRAFEDALRKRKIAYVLVGGMSFYERAEIKDCIAYLRLIVNPKDDISFDRICNVPARGLGDKSREALQLDASGRGCSELQALLVCDIQSLGTRAVKGYTELKELYELVTDMHQRKEPPHHILGELLKLSRYMDVLSEENTEESQGRIENINELLNMMAIWYQDNPERGLAEFLEEVTLVSDIDNWEKKESAVNLMTLHCAKGLEFKHVYLVGVEDGILPSKMNLDDPSQIEEERRLLYVGATRAMEMLQCSFALCRWRFGEIMPSIQSRFLLDIPPNLFSPVDASSNFASAQVAPNRPPLQKPQGATAQLRPGSSIGRQSPTQTSYSPARAIPPRTTPSYRQGSSVAPYSDLPSQRYNQREPDKDFSEPKQFDDFSQDSVQFRMGQYIRHKTYGRGRILSISGFGDDMRLTVLFNNGQRLKLMAKFANLD
jgi:DNA helicase-2/ATP-dependent DNA helicase PcrA